MFPGGINFVEITPEDHIFIEDIYKQIIKKYVKIIKSGNGNSAPVTEKVPTFQDAVKFLIEHANFNENDMENFVIRLKGVNHPRIEVGGMSREGYGQQID